MGVTEAKGLGHEGNGILLANHDNLTRCPEDIKLMLDLEFDIDHNEPLVPENIPELRVEYVKKEHENR